MYIFLQGDVFLLSAMLGCAHTLEHHGRIPKYTYRDRVDGDKYHSPAWPFWSTADLRVDSVPIALARVGIFYLLTQRNT